MANKTEIQDKDQRPDVGPGVVPKTTDDTSPNDPTIIGIGEQTSQRATKERLAIEAIREQVASYKGESFTETSQEKAPLVEFLQRLKASKGHYFGNIVHQGIRDHSAMGEHSGNEGEYSNEMEQIIESAHMKSEIRRLIEDEKALLKACEKIREIQEKESCNTQSAIERFIFLNFITGGESWQQLTDSLAIHFSSNHILDNYYGTETGNECFVLIPEDLTLQTRQYWSRGHIQEDLDTQYNDVYIWPTGENPGKISTNGALFFIPRDNQVEKSSGSTYQTDKGFAVYEIEQLDSYAKNAEEIKNKEKNLRRLLGYDTYESPFEFLTGQQYIRTVRDGIPVFTWEGEKRLTDPQRAAIIEYFTFIESTGLSPQILDSISSSYRSVPDDLYSKKTELESRFTDKEKEQVSKLLELALLHAYEYSEIGEILFYFFEIKEEHRENLSRKADQKLEELGFDIEMLKRILANNKTKKDVLDFIQSFSDIYGRIAKHSQGSFFKKAQDTTRSKDYYENFILRRLKDPKIQEIASEEHDIVEYQGINEHGEEEVIRVVYYRDKNPNAAVKKFYGDFGIEFDNRIINKTDKHADKETTFKDVKYDYDIRQLSQVLAERLAA
ncbi:MAG: hypothetical protein WC285_01445 [Candidatus Gracilibacteria bacterium]